MHRQTKKRSAARRLRRRLIQASVSGAMFFIIAVASLAANTQPESVSAVQDNSRPAKQVWTIDDQIKLSHEADTLAETVASMEISPELTAQLTLLAEKACYDKTSSDTLCESVRTAAQTASHLAQDARENAGYIIRDDITNIADNGWVGYSLPPEDQRVMQNACNKYDVPYHIALGLCQKESGFDPTQISPTNDYGYMQINECNIPMLSEMGLDVVNNPQDNITGGVYIFSQQYHAVGENPHYALMRYNFGPGRAETLWNQGTYSSGYSRQVMAYAEHWRELLYQEG